jgi:beta-glucuronidase
MNGPMNAVPGTAAVTGAALAALIAAPTARAAPGARTLYAAPDGHGTSCTVARPCSPEDARDRARTETGRDIRVLL